METLPDFDIELYEDFDTFIDQLVFTLQLVTLSTNPGEDIELAARASAISINMLRRVCWRLKNE